MPIYRDPIYREQYTEMPIYREDRHTEMPMYQDAKYRDVNIQMMMITIYMVP